MLVLSHRGHVRGTPENTIAGFDAAARLGVDGFETDVRKSADGHAVLHHDRHAAGAGDVARLDRADLSHALGHHVPTLEEALAAFPSHHWVIELKTPTAVEALVRALRSRPAGVECLVISFWHRAVREVQERISVAGGVLIPHCPVDVESALGSDLRSAGIDTLVWNYEYFEPSLAEAARARGYRNLVYSPLTREDHAACARLDLEAVITDQPALLLPPPELPRDRATAAARADGDVSATRPPPPEVGQAPDAGEITVRFGNEPSL